MTENLLHPWISRYLAAFFPMNFQPYCGCEIQHQPWMVFFPINNGMFTINWSRTIPHRLQVFVKEAEQQVEQVEAALVKVAEAAGGWDLVPLIVGEWTYEWDINEII